jgi:lycopene beta-cyclase
MPLSATTALVEFTLFTEKLLDQNSYETALKKYIKEQLSIDSYNIIHEEFGIIPMTNKRFSLHDGNIIHMGIAGGQVKGSSGYAFRFIQKRTAEIVAAIKETGRPFSGRSFANRKFLFYDSVMLHVLQKRKMEGMEIFSLIFQKNPPARVFRFLDNETGMMDDLKIMSSVPSAIFLPEAIQELFS